MITLKTLDKATAQEVYDQVANHLLTQNEKCVTDSGNCMYRYNGLKCAAGCLISDVEYNPEFESNSWGDLITCFGASSNHKFLIRDMQFCHDMYSVDKWPERLVKIAEIYGLKPFITQ